jgi:hypothetical protein
VTAKSNRECNRIKSKNAPKETNWRQTLKKVRFSNLKKSKIERESDSLKVQFELSQSKLSGEREEEGA